MARVKWGNVGLMAAVAVGLAYGGWKLVSKAETIAVEPPAQVQAAPEPTPVTTPQPQRVEAPVQAPAPVAVQPAAPAPAPVAQESTQPSAGLDAILKNRK